jgi:hypothetical protein
MRRNLLGGNIFFHFGGGPSAPPAPPAIVAPPKPDTPDNTPQANLLMKKGLQSTLLTGGGTQSQAGTLLGGGTSPLGSSVTPTTYGQPLTNGGQH